VNGRTGGYCSVRVLNQCLRGPFEDGWSACTFEVRREGVGVVVRVIKPSYPAVQ
jgi:hypothetical protein